MRSTLNAVSESHKEHLEFHAWRRLSTSLKISLPAEKKFIIHFTSTGEYFGFYTEGNKDAIVNFAGMPIRSSYFLETPHISPIYRDVFDKASDFIKRSKLQRVSLIPITFRSDWSYFMNFRVVGIIKDVST